MTQVYVHYSRYCIHCTSVCTSQILHSSQKCTYSTGIVHDGDMLFVVCLNQKLQVKTEKKLNHQLLVVVEVQGHLLEVWRTLHQHLPL